MRDISKNIKQLRIQKGITQDELAEMLFVTRQTVSNYETGKSRPDVDMLINIAAALDTDVNTVIYGVPDCKEKTKETKRIVAVLIVLAVLTAALAIVMQILKKDEFVFEWTMALWFVRLTVYPMVLFLLGWCVMRSLGILLKFKPLSQKWAKYVRLVLLILSACVIVVMLPYIVFTGIGLADKIIAVIRAKIANLPTYMVTVPTRSMVKIPLLAEIYMLVVHPVCFNFKTAFFFLGAALWMFGFPKKKDVS